MKRYKKNTIIEVSWIDIVDDPKWQDEDKIKRPDCDCKSVGYYFKHDKELLYISSTISNKERGILTIPVGCVKKIKKL